MRLKTIVLVTMAVLLVLSLAALSEARDVKVMVVIGLLDFGEEAKVISVADFNKYMADYGDFQKLLGRSITMREMVRDGWHTVQIAPITDDYFIVIFETGN